MSQENENGNDITSDIVITNINDEQIRCIETLFKDKNWNLDIKNFDNNPSKESYQCRDTQYLIPPVVGEKRCEFCFCQPCITNERNRQQWWGSIQEPSGIENSGKRKRCYQRFWAMMSHRHVWNIPEYLEKRTRSLSRNRDKNVIIHREIMPECVLQMVRHWYPNPPKVSYMGHKWC